MKSLLLLLFAIVLAAPAHASIPRYSINSSDFVCSGLQHFWVNGAPFRFVGYNLRGLVHYGSGYILDGSQTSDRETNLDYMQTVGAKVARVYAACRFAGSNTVLGNNLDAALQVASQHNVRLIVAFTDEYYSNFCPIGDGVYYGYAGQGLLNQSFFSGGYTTNYVSYVNYIVNRFKNDPTVFAWQVGNELKCPWNWADIMPFCHDMATRIRAIDTNHMVSYGTAGRSFSGLSTTQATQLYADFDFLTIHPYNGDDGVNDSSLAISLRKPLLVSEAGFDTDHPNRPASTDADINKWVGRGARGYMNWGLMVADNGDGDDIFGVDPFGHSYDWSAYTEVYTRWASTLATTPMPAPDAPANVGASDGTYATRVQITWNPSFAATQYAVYRWNNTTYTRDQISPWQSATSFFDSSVVRGTVYYYYVKAKNSGGESPFSSYDGGNSSAAPEVTVAQAKTYTDGNSLWVTGGIVSAAFANRFYLEQPNRTTGIMVNWSSPVVEGSHVNVLGTISTAGGERSITASSVEAQ